MDPLNTKTNTEMKIAKLRCAQHERPCGAYGLSREARPVCRAAHTLDTAVTAPIPALRRQPPFARPFNQNGPAPVLTTSQSTNAAYPSDAVQNL